MDYAYQLASGGQTSYGYKVGVLMLESYIPRIPGDPGHAATLNFPVCYEVIKGFSFSNLVNVNYSGMENVLDALLKLEAKGVDFIAASCGLWGPFQKDLSEKVSTPVIATPLDLVPFIKRFLSPSKRIGVITGDTNLLSDKHITAAGICPDEVVLSGMEACDEFRKVMFEHAPKMDIQAMRNGVINAALALKDGPEEIGSVVIECSNLIPFRSDIQRVLDVPVFDVVSLIEMFASGFRKHNFLSEY